MLIDPSTGEVIAEDYAEWNYKGVMTSNATLDQLTDWQFS